MKKFSIFSVVLQKLNRTPLLYLNTTFSEGNLQGLSASLNGVNHGLPSIYHALTFDSLACRLRVLPSRGVRMAAILCLLVTVGVGNAWGTTQRVSAYGDISSGQTYWIGATVSSTDYYFKAGGGITTTNSNLSGTSTTTPMTDGTVVKITISSTAANSKTGTIQFTNGYHIYMPSSNGKYQAKTSSQTWTFSANNSLIRMVNNNCAFQKNSGNSLNFGCYSAKGQKDVWLEPAYSVIYDKNGATGGTIPDTTFYLYNSTVTVSANSGTLVKTGYTFSGWNTQADGNGTNYTAGSGTFSITANKKLYAKWVSAGPACSDPSAPSKGSVTVNSVELSEGTSGNYDFYYNTSATAPTGSSTPSGSVSSGTSKTFTGLAYGTTYYYWARQDCGSNQSDWVAGSPTTFTTSAPKPTSVSAGSLKPTQATFTIMDSNSPASYDIYCSTSSTDPTAETTPSATGITGTSYTKTGLSAGTTYYYWVRGVGPNAKSDWLAGSGTTFTTPTLSSISVSTAPTKTVYLAGETFNPAGLVIQRNYSNSTNDTYTYADHTAEFTFSPSTATALTSSNDKVTITYGGKTVDQAITVYAVTLQAKAKTLAGDTPEAIAVGGPGAPTFTASTRAISPADDAGNYVFWQWEISGATLGSSATTKSNTITNPSGAVTLTAIYHKPITITWLKGGTPYETGSPTTKIGYNKQWKDLTPPTDPGDAALGSCANKFMGWSNSLAVEWVKEDKHTAPATLIKNAGFSGNTTAITSDITFRAVYANETASTTVYKRVTDISELSGASKIVIASNSASKVINTDCTAADAPDESSSEITPTSTYIWALSGNPTDGWKLKDGSGNTLGATTVSTSGSGNNNKPVSITASNSTWTIGAHNTTNCFYVCSGANTSSNACLDYYSGWQLYYVTTYSSNSYTAMKLYIPKVTNSDYVTVCCAQHDITLASSGSVSGGTFNAGGTASACEGAKVTLSATPSDGYVFAGWTVTKTASPYTDITSTNVDGNTLTMPDYDVTVNATFATVSSISVNTAPTKTTYCQGEYFDPTGLVITANYSNSTSGTVAYSGNEAKFTFSPGLSTGLTTGNTSVSITYGGKSTSQAITVNALRTITKTGSGTVTGGTFTVDNASACVGATITIEAEAASHYTFNSWTITKAGGGTVTPASSTSASTTFTMPDDAVTVTPTFTEGAYKTVIFMNNNAKLYSGDGFDATNKWKQKVYIGESPVTPTKLTDGYGSGDACNSTSTLFYGWTRRTWDDDIDDESDVKALTGVETVYKSSLPAITAETTDTIYHAVWAAGEAAPTPTAPTPLIYWARQSIAASTNISATSGTGTLNSNVAFTSDTYAKVYNSGSLSSYPTITLTGLTSLSSATGSTVSISFFTRGTNASKGTLTVKYTDQGEEATAGTATVLNGKIAYHEVSGIPKTATQIKLEHGANSGNLAIGTIKIFEPNTTSYTFTELTSENTNGWANEDWDGYYLITNSQVSLQALEGNGIGENNLTSVTASDGVISTTKSGAAFKVTWVSGSGFKIQGVGSGDYLNTASNSVAASADVVYLSSMTYNGIVDGSSNTLQWNSKFGFYSSSQTAIKLYKIMNAYSTFRTTCCDKLTVTKGGSTAGTVTGGTFTVDKDEACEDEEVTLSVISTTTGYNFDHWTVAKTASPFTDYSSNVSENTLTMPGVPVTVTAVFATAHTTTVTLDNQGADEGHEGEDEVTATVNLAMPSISEDLPEKTGYTFGGYYTATNGSGTQYYDADGNSAHVWDDGENDEAILYAKWTAGGYTVTLDNASATSAGTESVSVTYGANTNLTSAITCPEKTNKVFGGYYTGESGAGTQLIDADGNWLPSVASYTDVNRNWLYANNLTLHAKWSNIDYTNYRTTCGPEITVSEEAVYLTSYPGCEVLTTGTITVSSTNWGSTVGAPKYLRFKLKDMVGGTTYAFTTSNITSSEFRVYRSAGNGARFADAALDTIPTGTTSASYTYRIAYTPAASVYNTRDHYTLLIEVMDNSATKKTLTMETVELYGRTLPEQFAIATKKGDVWYALPNDLASSSASAKATKALEITVDNATTPTCALYAPKNVLYKATGYYTGVTVANRNRSGLRFTRDGSQYLQVSTTGSAPMWLSTTGGTDVQDWYLDGGTSFTSYTVKMDPRGGSDGYRNNKLGMYGSNIGFYSSPTSPSEQIYFLPVESSTEEADVVEWGKNSIVVEVDATDISATKVIGRIGSTATAPITLSQTKTSGKGGATKYNYTINFGNTFDFTAKKGDKLYLDWLNSSGTVVGSSMVAIPWLIDGTKTMSSDIDAVKTHWSSAEVHVLPGATLTANAGSYDGSVVTIGQLEIYPGATVKVTSGTLNVSDLVLRYGWTRAGEKAYSSAELQIKRGEGGANLTATRAYADWYIDYDQYYPIAVPWKVAVANITYWNSNSAASAGMKLRYYDGESRANPASTGSNWKEYGVSGNLVMPDTLRPSMGYALSAKRPTGKAFSILRMPLTIPSNSWTALGEQGVVSAAHKDQVSVTGWGNGENIPWYAKGWNFIGNPYMATFNGNDEGIYGKLAYENGSGVRYATIPDAGFKDYNQVNITEANILPATGFFIQSNNAEAQNITFASSQIAAPSAPARYTNEQEAIPEQEAYIRLSHDGGKDQMGLIIGGEYTEAYEVNADLSKILGEANTVKTYMQYGSMEMAYVAINEHLAREFIPVTVHIPAAGEYTYSLLNSSTVDELEAIYLTDFLTGETTNLLYDDYSFIAQEGTVNDRFALNAIVGERKVPTGADVAGLDKDDNKPIKFVWHDKVYILHGGVIYDSTGKRVNVINK